MTSIRLLLLFAVACGEHRGGENEKCREAFACDRGLTCDGEICVNSAALRQTMLPESCDAVLALPDHLAPCANEPAEARAVMDNMIAAQKQALRGLSPDRPLPPRLGTDCALALQQLKTTRGLAGCSL